MASPAVLPIRSAVGVKEISLAVVLFLYCSVHTPSQHHRVVLILAQEREARPTATIEVKTRQTGWSWCRGAIMKGDLAEPVKELTAKLAESYGSLSLGVGRASEVPSQESCALENIVRHVRATTLLWRYCHRCAWCTRSWQFPCRRSRSRVLLGEVFIVQGETALHTFFFDGEGVRYACRGTGDSIVVRARSPPPASLAG